MRVLRFHLWCDTSCCTCVSPLSPKGLKLLTSKVLILTLAILPLANLFASPLSEPVVVVCDNVVNGGTIAGDEFGCPNPTWDPAIITSVSLPTGGSGNLEFLWIFTTSDPTSPLTQWTPITGTNSPEYDPGPLSVTTYFRRCAKRSGCVEYVGESNIIVKEALCCDNITNGGTIGSDQLSCLLPFDPALLTNIISPSGGSNVLEYQWVISTTGTPYSATNPDWAPIANTNADSYDPNPANQTTYFIRLSRRHGCLDYNGVSNMVTIAISNNLAATTAPDAVTCFGGSDGSIDLTATGGALPYTYQWSGNLGTPADPSGLQAGNYSVTVTDANGCTTTANAAVPDGIQITVTTTATAETCNGADNGTVAVSNIAGGLAPYNLVWNTTPPQSTSPILDLASGAYLVTITDAQGCTSSSTVTVTPGPSLAVTLSGSNVICFGKNQGSAGVIDVQNGVGGYNYLWNNGQDTQNLSDLFAGVYTVTLTDSQGCIGSSSITISDGPQIFTNTSHTNATCNYITDGSTTVVVSGGVPLYSYQWNDPNWQTGSTASALAAGTYSVTITDANGCTATASETVEAPIPAEILISGTNISCFNGSNGVATVTVVNNNPANYHYIWDNPAASTTPTVNGLTAGTYGVTVTDNNGCLVTESVTLTQPSQLLVSILANDATCGNGSDGSIVVTATGGTPLVNGTYNYQWSANNSPNVNTLDDISPGNYTVTVTDGNNCTVTASATIGAPPILTANLTLTDIACFGMANGQLSVTAGGGIPPYSYLWNDPSASTGTSITNLPAGNYNVVVTDAVGCSVFATAAINQPTQLTVSLQKFDVICVDATNGSAIAIPAGGVSPYTYHWAGGQTTANLANLGTGTYSVTVTDANGCTVAGSIQIISTTTLSLTTAKVDANCFTSNDGSATAIVTGGTAPISYHWNNGTTTALNANLLAGTYSVTVTDADGCDISSQVVVASPPLLTAPATSVSNITTYGGNNGSVQVTPAGGIGPYSVLWNTSSTQTLLSGLSAGIYTVTTTDAHGCTASSAVTLSNPSKIGNFVWHDLNQNGIQETGEPGLDSVKLHLIGATTTGIQIHFTTYSDTAGFYAFDGLAAGTYQVKVDLPTIHVFSPMNVGNDLLDSDINPADSSTAIFTLAIGNYESRWDVGMIELDEKTNIGDFVWQDADHDGIQDVQEQGIGNYTIRLFSMPSNTLIDTKTTNAIGKYLFTDVMPGLYQVEFALANLPNGQVYSPQNQGSNDNIDSDVNPATGRTATFQVFPFTVDNLTIDAGVFKECDNVTDGGLIGQNEALCGIGADPAEIVSLASPTGGFGVLEYLWLKSTVPVFNGPGDPNWTPIPNSNSPNYNPGPINQSTYYLRCSRRQGCPEYPGESNIVSKTITPNPLAQIIDHPTVICTNEGDRFEAAIAGGGATYNWNFDIGSNPTTAATRVVDPVYWTTEGTKTASLTVTRFGCSVTVNTSVAVNICGDPLIVIFEGLLAELNGESVDIQWQVSGLDVENTVFFVQRSEDGLSFSDIGALNGIDKNSVGIYHFQDTRPRLGANTYRIKYYQTGLEYNQGFSSTTSIFNRPEGTEPVQLYPNPTIGRMTVEFLKPSSKPSILEVYDAFGRMKLKLEIPALTEKVPIDLSHFSLGVYWVRIKSDNVLEQITRVVKSE